MDSLTDVLAELATAGYTASFFAADGKVACADCADLVEPASLMVDRIVRLEGESDPDEELIVYALSQGPCGRRGTFTTAYGSAVPDADLVVEHALRHHGGGA